MPRLLASSVTHNTVSLRTKNGDNKCPRIFIRRRCLGRQPTGRVPPVWRGPYLGGVVRRYDDRPLPQLSRRRRLLRRVALVARDPGLSDVVRPVCQDKGTAGLLDTRSDATFRVEAPVAVVRVNVGVDCQDLEIDPDENTVLPELGFWQTDLCLDELQLSDDVTGDTSRSALDDEEMPVTSGLSALHRPVESYHVANTYARDFKKLHG